MAPQSSTASCIGVPATGVFHPAPEITKSTHSVFPSHESALLEPWPATKRDGTQKAQGGQRGSPLSLLCLLCSVPLPQCKCKKGCPGRNGDVLFSIDRVRDRPAVDLPAERHLPKQFARTSIQCKQISIAAAAKEEIGCGSQDASPRGITHFVLPLLLTGRWIKSSHHAITFCVRSEVRKQFHVGHRCDAGVAGARAEIVDRAGFFSSREYRTVPCAGCMTVGTSWSRQVRWA